MDLLITGGVVLPMDAARSSYLGDVLVRDGRVFAVGPDLVAQASRPHQRLDARGHAVLPSFTQTHLHLAHTLFGGLCDQVPGHTWQRERVWRMDAALTPEMVRAAARLGMASLLLSGTTTVLDFGTLRHVEALFEAGREMGLRLTSGKVMLGAPLGRGAGKGESPRAALSEAERLRRKWHGAAGGRLRYAYAPHDALSCPEELLVELIGRARGGSCLMQCRAAETSQEVEEVRARFGADTISHLHEIGLTGVDVVLAHCVWLTAREQKLLKESKTRVSHCPVSNLRLGAGVAKAPELVGQGVQVSLGMDSAATTGTLDLFEAMRATALIHRTRVGVKSLSPLEVLEMATIRGADAVGLGQEIGSLEAGKRADLIIVDLQGVHARSAPDAESALVFACRGADVRHVLIDGRFVVRDHELLPLDVAVIGDDAERAAALLRRKVS